MKIWQPIVNCGFLAGEFPKAFIDDYTSFVGFETEDECQKWIDNNIDNFSMAELGGCVCPMEFDVEEPTIIDADGNAISISDVV